MTTWTSRLKDRYKWGVQGHFVCTVSTYTLVGSIHKQR